MMVVSRGWHSHIYSAWQIGMWGGMHDAEDQHAWMLYLMWHLGGVAVGQLAWLQ